MFYQIIKHLHSGFRWLVITALLLSIILSIFKLIKKRSYTPSDRIISMIASELTHIQLLIGAIVYFISPKVIFSTTSFTHPVSRFYLVEHVTAMIIAITLITIGYILSKKAVDDTKKFRQIVIFYSIGLILLLVFIPWPFQNYGAWWF
ncbi:MAG: hypothetical protein JXJ22_05090 [Bacteroidales bacterium]|nr:hypothetical protein [Bacteroidales bacterium]